MRRAFVGAAALVLCLNPTLAAAGPYRNGELVAIAGRVTDAGGAALAGVTVVLEASRRDSGLGRLFRRRSTQEKTNTLQVPTTTDTQGHYSFEWRWDSYYDSFELAVALPVRKSGQQTFEVFERTDITESILRSNPVTVPMVVEDTSYFEWLRRFLANQASEDEKRIYREAGRPDRVDEFERLAGTESSWWYFADGKAYRFLGGELQQVTHFDPIPSVDH